MNESNNEIQKVHEATRALQGIAEDIERERAERGRADSDPRGESEGRAMSDEATFSEDHPDGAADAREDHRPGAVGGEGSIESSVQGVLDAAPNWIMKPH